MKRLQQLSRKQWWCLHAVLAALFLLPLAIAHTILDPDLVTAKLADLGRLHQAASSTRPVAERAEAFYNIGLKAAELVNLINEDAMAHGDSDPKLVQLIITSLKAYGVSVNKFPTGYAYDLAAFREYLKIAPTGRHAAQARFVLIKYGAEAEELAFADVPGLENAIAEASEFARRYPNYPEIAYIELVLAREHIQAARLIRSDGRLSDDERDRRAQAHQQDAERLLSEIVDKHPNSREAADARNYLASFTH